MSTKKTESCDFFGGRIAKILINKGIEPKDFSDKTSIPLSTVHSVLRGETKNPGIDFLIKAAEADIFTSDEFYCILTGETPTTMDATPKRKMLVELYEKASDDDKSVVEVILRKYKTKRVKHS